MPGKFLYEYKGNTIIFIIAYTVSGVEAISPYPIDLKYEYVITEKGKEKIRGEGLIKNEETPLSNQWKSSKKFTWMYLDNFQKEADRMGKVIVQDLIDKMKE